MRLVLLVLSYPAFSQTIDNNAKRLNDSASYYYDRCCQFDKAWTFELQANELSLTMASNEDLCKSYSLRGNIEHRRGQIRHAQQFHKKRLEVANRAGEINWRAHALSNLASLLSVFGEYDSAQIMLTEIVNSSNVNEEIVISAYGRLGVNLKRR